MPSRSSSATATAVTVVVLLLLIAGFGYGLRGQIATLAQSTPFAKVLGPAKGPPSDSIVAMRDTAARPRDVQLVPLPPGQVELKDRPDSSHPPLVVTNPPVDIASSRPAPPVSTTPARVPPASTQRTSDVSRRPTPRTTTPANTPPASTPPSRPVTSPPPSNPTPPSSGGATSSTPPVSTPPSPTTGGGEVIGGGSGSGARQLPRRVTTDPDSSARRDTPASTTSSGGASSGGASGGAGSGGGRDPGPTPGATATGRIPSGAAVALRSIDQVCTDRTKEGEKFRAVVQDEVAGSNGARIPKGALVTFVISRLRRGPQPNDKLEFAVAPETIEIAGGSYALAASTDSVAMSASKGHGLVGAVTGGLAGVIAAKAAGGSTKDAVAGGVAGGAAGAVVGNQLRSGGGCIEKGAAMRVTLRTDLTLRAM